MPAPSLSPPKPEAEQAATLTSLQDDDIEITAEPGAAELDRCIQQTKADRSSGDSLSLLFEEARRHPPLSPADELHLARAIMLANRAQAAAAVTSAKHQREWEATLLRGRLARERLILSNLKLAVYMAKRCQFFSSLSLDDLAQEGMLGLMRAADKFNPQPGRRFATYAMHWIRHSILRAIANRGATIRVPVHRVRDLSLLRQALSAVQQENGGREPTLREIAQALDWTPQKVACLQEVSAICCVSLEAGPEEESELNVASRLKSDILSPDEQCIAREQAQLIRTLVDRLPRRERDVILRRFGLSESGEEESLEEIGRDHRLTQERIRQIERDALKMLRRLARHWGLIGN